MDSQVLINITSVALVIKYEVLIQTLIKEKITKKKYLELGVRKFKRQIISGIMESTILGRLLSSIGR